MHNLIVCIHITVHAAAGADGYNTVVGAIYVHGTASATPIIVL